MDPKVATSPLLQRVLADVAGVDGNTERFRAGQMLRSDDLFQRLEESEPARKLICYLTGPGGGAIDLGDAAPIASMLDAVGNCERLDLMINSPGGSGEAAEKIVEMCRAHCSKEFRVIVPNFAKSAATLVALGADVVVMGYVSELGPIDPQYTISIGSVYQSVSGQSFIQAFQVAQDKIAEAVRAGEPAVGYMQALGSSTLEPAFIEHCRRGIEFSRDFALKYLPKYQLPAKYAAMGETRAPSTLRNRAKKVAENLLSRNTRFTHGRLIGATEARDDVGLHVDILEKESPTWNAYWELYVRAEVYMQTRAVGETRVSKLFFDRNSALPVY